VDKQRVGPKYSIEFDTGVEPTAESAFADRAKVAGTRLDFPKPLEKQAAFGRLIQPADKSPFNGNFKMTYRESDAKWVRVHVGDTFPDHPRTKFQVWAIGTVLCPEPFFDLRIEPGEATSWITAYRFETPHDK
jgi:hypothetical protein